jgi:hypothetical protein
VPLSPDEIAVSAMPQDEATEEHHNNPHLVARIVMWDQHDLSYKSTFAALVAGVGTGAPTNSLAARIRRAAGGGPAIEGGLSEEQLRRELLDEEFVNRYEKAWYHHLYSAYAMIIQQDVSFADFHTRLGEIIDRLVRLTPQQWQDHVVRGFLANREICLNHDASIIGRLCYYTDKKEQNLYAPLFIGNM